MIDLNNSGMAKLPCKDYESLDYDVCYNQPFSKMLASRDKKSFWLQEVMRWLVTAAIGVLTGLVAVFINYFVTFLTQWKFDTVNKSLIECTPRGCLAVTLLILMAFNAAFCVVAGILCAIEPVAAGSGIPEIKCYLNGVKVPHVVRFKTLVCKAVGVLFSVAGGLFVGKEGPMIHSGAIIGAGLPQFQSIAFRRIKINFPYFRTDREKRDFVSGGAAAGVAAAFGAPIGGVLFSLEEGSSFWNQALTWRSFFCSMASTFTLNFFLSGILGYEWGSFNQPGLLSFGVFSCSKAVEKCNLWNIQDLLIFIGMGFVGGLLGAWFNQLNKHLTVHRLLNINLRPKYVRILEVLLVACITTSVAFFSPIYLAYCKTLPVGSRNTSDTKDYFCQKGEYNDMATLFFTSQESAIRQLFHLDGEFSLTSLGIFFICFYFLACWTYGASVPSGLFVPCLLCGAAYGRFVGELCRMLGYQHTYHGTFALIGAASFLGGVVRMTISLTVILIESTNEISYGLPIMITLMVAKWSGDLFNEGLYDIHVKLKSVPLLEWTVPQEMYRLKASDIMESCLSYIYPHTRVHSIVGILRTTAHNAFPVVTVDKPVQHNVQEDNFQSNFNFSFNERFARSSTLPSLRSEQKLLQHVSSGEDRMLRPKRGRTSSDLILQNEHLDIKRKRVQSESERDYLTDSSSVPELPSFIDRGMRRIHFKDEGFPGSAERHSEENEPQGLMFHGIILRSQLVTLLKKRVFYSENSERLTCTELDFASMTEDYPRFPDIHDLHIEFEDQQKIMDVTTYMNPCPYMVFPWTPVPLVFNLFRTMGLRHLIVINTKGQLVGMITRFNLTHEYMEYCLENQNGD
ncbi:H(+)/Cl(-) exchange transporter 6-like isoform X2 [Montipora foliosa]|uniref:H(+)/Cl(-) exchange transporter 6-like isoform X2 n=1 Tax=Montipora foliosa TaxID=591990 RepID=UPI0035F1C985